MRQHSGNPNAHEDSNPGVAMNKALGWIAIIIAGAIILSPAIGMIGLQPLLPADFTLRLGATHIYLPLGTSLAVSVSLTLLFLFMRR
jgi:hypothetical protein